MHSVTALLTRNLSVFGERNSEARKIELQALWLPDGVFIDPDGRYVGHEAIDQRIDELQKNFPDFKFIERGPVMAMHGVGRLAWGFGPESDRTAVTGVDIAVVFNGRLRELYAFIDSDI
jgi:hypothetical protein